MRAGKKKMIGWSGMQLRGSSKESLRVLWGIPGILEGELGGRGGSLGNFKKKNKKNKSIM